MHLFGNRKVLMVLKEQKERVLRGQTGRLLPWADEN